MRLTVHPEAEDWLDQASEVDELEKEVQIPMLFDGSFNFYFFFLSFSFSPLLYFSLSKSISLSFNRSMVGSGE